VHCLQGHDEVVANDTPSPDGRFHIWISSSEVRMSHWVERPTLTDTQTRQNILYFQDSNWSLDQAVWLDDHTVQLVMRKYPGNHQPVDVTATVDCLARTAKVGDREVKHLFELEGVMDSVLKFDWP
jgi:hypothetical protein